MHIDHQGHFEEAFFPMPGCCFRQVTASHPGSEESLRYCSLPVVSFGRFRDSQGRWHDVEACVSHDGDLTETFPVNQR